MFTRSIRWAGLNQGKLAIRFEHPRTDEGIAKFNADLDLVRSLKGRAQFYGNDRVWRCSLTEENVVVVMDAGFNIAINLYEWFKAMTKVPFVRTIIQFPPGLKRTLRPYQVENVGFLLSRNGKALIGDDMGLGKTISALSWLHYTGAYPALVVCPAIGKLNWLKEIEKTLPAEITAAALFSKGGDIGFMPDIAIINYDILKDWRKSLPRFKSVILDECHKIKNRATKRAKACRAVARHATHLIGMSGRPIENRPVEFFSFLSMVAPETFSSFWDYAKKYCEPKMGPHGWTYKGATNLQELHKLLTKTVMIRHKKENVEKDLPPKTRVVVPIEINNMDEYQYAESNFTQWVREAYGEHKMMKARNAQSLAKIEYLKQLTIKGKMSGVLDWVSNFLESGEKLVIFAIHHSTVDRLMDEFGKIAVKIDGRDNATRRSKAEDMFQHSSTTRVLVGNLQACGEVINLTAASNSATIELGWKPTEHDQAEDREHRIGQLNPVTAWYLIAHRTIEEEIAALIDTKRQVVSNVLDGGDAEEGSILTALLDKILKGGQENGGHTVTQRKAKSFQRTTW